MTIEDINIGDIVVPKDGTYSHHSNFVGNVLQFTVVRKAPNTLYLRVDEISNTLNMDKYRYVKHYLLHKGSEIMVYKYGFNGFHFIGSNKVNNTTYSVWF